MRCRHLARPSKEHASYGARCPHRRSSYGSIFGSDLTASSFGTSIRSDLTLYDFYCAAARLAIEVDGVAHDMGDNPRRDACRDAWLMDQDVETLRINAEDVFREFEVVVRLILSECSRRL